MSKYYINGIQQIGLGVTDIYPSWQWYIDHFNFDLPIFDDKAVADLMLPYTDGQARERHAVLALNYQGGGGLEIWKHLSFNPRGPSSMVNPGDLGIYAPIIKVKSITRTFEHLKSKGLKVGPIDYGDLAGFYTQDLYGNRIKIMEAKTWHTNLRLHSGGIMGAVIGVSDLNKSIDFYKKVLGYDVIEYEYSCRSNLLDTEASNYNLDVVRLKHSDKKSGVFSKLLGPSIIELVRAVDYNPNKIFKDKMWGELGYIHLCFDVTNMDHLKKACKDLNYPFKVDSGSSFDMGEAAGRFAYIEDPDGTLIEFVEAYKVTLIKKLGIAYKISESNKRKTLPKWISYLMGKTRIKKVRE